MRPNALVQSKTVKSWAAAAAVSASAAVMLVGLPAGHGAPAGARASITSRLPVAFIPNQGQAHADVLYTAKAPGLTAHFKARGTLIKLGSAVVAISLDGTDSSPEVAGLDGLEGKAHFLTGNDPSAWRTGVPMYGRIVYRQVYPGVDLYYAGADGRLKSEFVVSPAADPALIRVRYAGVSKLRLDEAGGLVLTTSQGELREEKPEIYQDVEGRRVAVEGGFRLLADGAVGFWVGRYDRGRPLVIDPVLSYSTYLGGSGLDVAKAIAVDSAGNAHVAGYTDSADFVVRNALQPRTGGGVDAFVAKLNAAGTSLVYCSYLGGGWDDRAFGIAVDSTGHAFVTGWTNSPNFPTTSGARQRALAGGRDAFVARLNAAGSGLVYSTYLGGSGNDSGNGIAVDGSGNVYVAGDTYSANFPAANGFQSSYQGRQDAFAVKLNATDSALAWSTYLGGRGDDYGAAIALDGAGNAYVTGATDSGNFPILGALQAVIGGGQDAFVTKLNGGVGILAFSTYLGGSGGATGANEMGTAIAVDPAGSAYVTGITSSTNFPAAGAYQSVHGGGIIDAFVAKLNPSGNSLEYSTYLGGNGLDYALGIALDPAGSATVAGYTSSANFPVLDALQPSLSGGYDGFVATLHASGSGLTQASYLGGAASDSVNAVAAAAGGSIFAAGQTLSSNFPVRNAVQALNAGALSAFVMKLAPLAPRAVLRTTSGAAALNYFGSPTLHNAGGTIASDPGIAVNSAGDTFVVGRNTLNQVWMNVFLHDSQSWRGWVSAGSGMAGNPAVAAAANGEAYVVSRDASFGYWINRYRPASGFEGWISLGGGFTTDPEAVLGPDGTVFIFGRTGAGAISSGRFVPAQGFRGWVSGGGSAAGKPSAAIGSDGGVYVAIRGTNQGVWMARLQGDTWGGWFDGGGALASDPQVARAARLIYAMALGSNGGVYIQPFREGAANGWQGWFYTGGTLEAAAIATSGDRYYVFGRNALKDLWWYESVGAGWSLLGYRNWAAGNPASGPR